MAAKSLVNKSLLACSRCGINVSPPSPSQHRDYHLLSGRGLDTGHQHTLTFYTHILQGGHLETILSATYYIHILKGGHLETIFPPTFTFTFYILLETILSATFYTHILQGDHLETIYLPPFTLKFYRVTTWKPFTFTLSPFTLTHCHFLYS